MTITINASNSTSITVNANNTDTIKNILANSQVLSFFNASAEDVIANFEYYEDENGSEVDTTAILTAVPEDNTSVYVSLPGRTAAPAPAPVNATINGEAAIPVTGTILVKWNGGMNTCTLTGIQLGTATVGTVLQNGYVASRFGTTVAAMSACDITVQNGDNVSRVSQAAASTRPVVDGDVIWLQARAADDKGNC